MSRFDEVADLLTSADLDLERDPEAGVLRGAFEVGDEVLHVAVVVDEEDEALLVYAVADDVVPQARRADVAQVAARANWGLLGVTVELDLDDGEVRTRASLDLQLQQPTGPLLARLVRDALTTAAMYLPAVAAVVAGTASPADAVAAAEGA